MKVVRETTLTAMKQLSDGDGDDGVAGAERRRVVAWEYEPLPVGEPGENVGDAEHANAENRLHANVEDW